MGITGSPEKIEKKEKKTHSVMKSVGVMSFVAFIIMISTIATVSQAYATTNDRRAVSQIIPFEDIADSSCESGDGGELIEISGRVHVVDQIAVNEETGTFHINHHVNFQGVKGEGLTTGAEYRVPNAFNSVSNFDIERGGGTATDVTSFQLVSQGQSAQDLLVNAVFHITVNANGEVTSEIQNFRVVCR